MAPLSLVFPPSPPRFHPLPGPDSWQPSSSFLCPGRVQIFTPQAHIPTALFRLATQTVNLHTVAISRRWVTCRPGTEHSTWSSPPTPGPAVWQLAKRPSGSDIPLLFLLA